jgi:hypothetical protein
MGAAEDNMHSQCDRTIVRLGQERDRINEAAAQRRSDTLKYLANKAEQLDQLVLGRKVREVKVPRRYGKANIEREATLLVGAMRMAYFQGILLLGSDELSKLNHSIHSSEKAIGLTIGSLFRR